MARSIACVAVFLVAGIPAVPAQKTAPGKLLIAFASYRERPKYPSIYFYEHDGIGNGKIIGSAGTPKGAANASGQPSLTPDGRYCVFTHEVENKTSRIFCWDLKEQKLVDLEPINNAPPAHLGPSISRDGNLIAFTAWNRPGSLGNGWHVYLYDRAAKKHLDLPDLNSSGFHDRMAVLSGDGRFIAFTSNRKEGAGLSDIYLYDRQSSRIISLPGLNTKYSEQQPSLNSDGSLIAFVAEKTEGQGGRDIYLFDRTVARYVPLPGLNTSDQEHSPSLSPDGRFITFVSERLGGEGERDIYLYDRQAAKLLSTPGLNSKQEDFDPCVIVLP